MYGNRRDGALAVGGRLRVHVSRGSASPIRVRGLMVPFRDLNRT